MLKILASFLIIVFILASICNSSGFMTLSAQNSLYRANATTSQASVSGDINFADQPSVALSNGSDCQLVVGLNRTRQGAGADLADIIDQIGGKVVTDVSVGGAVDAVVVDVPKNNYSIIGKVAEARGLVRYVEPNLLFSAQFEPNDPYYGLQWALPRIRANWAWNTTRGNSTVLVCTVDTGIDYMHPDLVHNYAALGYDWVNNVANPLDDNGHGTVVSGIIAAQMNNGIGIAGIAQVRIMSEKALNATGWGNEVDLANAITDAVGRGAKILSNSWGSASDSELIHDAIRYAYSQNVLVIAAAGNNDTNTLFYPAAYPEVISVSATDQFDAKADFSNWGNWIELAAPGVDVYSTMPTYHVSLNDAGYNSNYDFLSGTSMACPQVVGVAALIWSEFPNVSRDWVREQLRSSADNVGSFQYFGFGRVDAQKAVEQGPSMHDVAIYNYQAPARVQPGDDVLFNVSVLNFGLSDEFNLGVELLVNGVQTDFATIPSLPSGISSYVALDWKPAVAQTYNVTFYVAQVLGETNTANNVVSLTIDVFFPVTLNPDGGPIGTTVTVNGRDFTPDSTVQVSFNDLFIGTAPTDSSGSFTLTFNVPVSSAGLQLVKATDLIVSAQANFTVLDVTPLDVQVDTGVIHFRGETVTFYVQTVFEGQAVSAAITSAVLYEPDGTNKTLTAKALAMGLYSVTYELPNDAPAGLYALSITANYTDVTVESLGTFFKSFLVSETLSGWNAILVQTNSTIGTIKTDLGILQVNLNQINATLESINGDTATLTTDMGTIEAGLFTLQPNVTSINGTSATIQTVIGSINGTVTGINGDIATILIPRVGQLEANVTDLQKTRGSWTTPQYVILGVALAATVSAIISIIMVSRKKKTGTVEPQASASEPKEDTHPTDPSVQNPVVQTILCQQCECLCLPR
jgi:thermitase